MNDTPVFEIHLPGYSLRTLHEADRAALQRLCEKCADYYWIVEGQGVPPGEAEEMFHDLPPGRSLEDKFLFGLFDPEGELAAVLEGCKDYPEASDWWIGLLMLAPEARGQGIGRKLVGGFAGYVRRQGGATILLGVVEDNQAAYAFWQRLGFRLHAQREPSLFGKKRQAVYVLRRAVPEDERNLTHQEQR